MGRKFYRNWLVVFVVFFLIDVVWHALIWSNFYATRMGDVARTAHGRLAPLILFIIIGDILATFGYTYFVTIASSTPKRFIANGLLAGFVITAPFTLWNYALLPGWDGSLVALDLVYSLFQGLLMGLLLMRLNRGA